MQPSDQTEDSSRSLPFKGCISESMIGSKPVVKLYLHYAWSFVRHPSGSDGSRAEKCAWLPFFFFCLWVHPGPQFCGWLQAIDPWSVDKKKVDSSSLMIAHSYLKGQLSRAGGQRVQPSSTVGWVQMDAWVKGSTVCRTYKRQRGRSRRVCRSKWRRLELELG